MFTFTNFDTKCSFFIKLKSDSKIDLFGHFSNCVHEQPYFTQQAKNTMKKH